MTPPVSSVHEVVTATRAVPHMAGFMHFLRAHGFSLGIHEAVQNVQALSLWQQSDLPDVRCARAILRTLSCHTPAEWEAFPQLFERYWFLDRTLRLRAVDVARSGTIARLQSLSGISGGSEEDWLRNEINASVGSGAGKQQTIARADFRFINNRAAMRQLERLTEHLADRMRFRLQRRYRIRTRGRRLDLRQVMRGNLCHGGEPSCLYFRHPRMIPLHLLILHDVSHSMTWNNPLLFRFVRGLIQAFADSEAFAFHTRLFRVTPLYRERSLERLRTRLEQRNYLWMGGTCIAASLADFYTQYARRYLSGRTIVLIISDGLDTNDPQQTAIQIQKLRRNCKRLVWLNPMIGRNGYMLDEQNMEILLPSIDRMFSANNVDALRQACNYIVQVAA